MANVITNESDQDELLFKVADLCCDDKHEEALELMKQLTLDAETLKLAKALYGKEKLLTLGFNLEPAEKAFGKDWLNG